MHIHDRMQFLYIFTFNSKPDFGNQHFGKGLVQSGTPIKDDFGKAGWLIRPVKFYGTKMTSVRKGTCVLHSALLYLLQDELLQVTFVM